jgi:hypothetical protein
MSAGSPGAGHSLMGEAGPNRGDRERSNEPPLFAAFHYFVVCFQGDGFYFVA